MVNILVLLRQYAGLQSPSSSKLNITIRRLERTEYLVLSKTYARTSFHWVSS